MISSFAKSLLVKFQEYETIAIFVHVNPDFDAYASAFGVRKWIKDNFPNITTYLMIPPGTIKPEEESLFSYDKELPDEEYLKNALGIVLDTPVESRILTKMHTYCKELVSIDHHPKSHSFAELEFIDPSYPAVCQILAEIFFYLESNEGGGYIFDEELVQYFYAGIITDTNNFLSMSVLPSTFTILSKLISKGLDRSEIHQIIFNKSLRLQLLTKRVLEKCRLTENGLIFSIIDKSMIKKSKVDNFPNPVSVLENVPNIEVWSTLTYDSKSKRWNCSIRSKNINVSEVAKLYGGGGHKKMSAVTFKNRLTYYQILATLDDYLSRHNFANVTINDLIGCWQLWLIKFMGAYKKL